MRSCRGSGGCVWVFHNGGGTANAAPVIPLSSSVSGTVVGISTNLYVRNGPSQSNTVIGYLQNGNGVTIVGYTSDGWLQISAPAPAGYVSSQYVNVPVVSVSSDNSASITVGDTAQVGYAVFPGCATNLSVSWSTSDSSVVTVDSSGKVTGRSVGTATVTVRTAQGGFTATTSVTVTPRAVSGVSLNQSSSSLQVGASETLVATVSPSSASDQTVSWSSSDAQVVTVDANGKVTGVGDGTATVTVTTRDGGFTASCDYSVSSVPVAVTGVSLDRSTLGIGVGQSDTLRATVAPSNASDRSVTWSSSNTSVATVDSSGKVTAVKVGSATVTVKTTDGNFTAACAVTVSAQPAPAASTLSISGGMTVPNPLKTGNAVTVKGTVSSNYTLTNVTATIKTSGGSVKYNQTINPNAKTFNLNKWDNSLLFSRLAAGNYVYTVSAKDSSGASKTLVNQSFTVGTSVAVTGVTVTSGVPMMSGKTQTLKATVAPSNASNKSVSWSSDATKTATVNASGVVTGKITGTGKSAKVKITVKTASGSKTAATTFMVYTVQDVQAKLNALVCRDANNKSLVVDGSFGTNSTNALKAFQKAAGKTASGAPDGGTLTVLFGANPPKCGTTTTTTTTVAVSSVTVTPTGMPVMSGRTQQLKATVNPAGASSVTWSSTRITTATVSASGLVTGKITGKGKSENVTVTVKTAVGAKTATTTFMVYTVQDVQAKLNELVCKDANKKVLTVDGAYGTNSTNAMKSFQKTIGRSQTGTPDGDTLKALFAKNAPKCGTAAVPATGVTLNKPAERTLPMGSSDVPIATMSPSNATDQGFTWTSSDKNVVTVTDKGLVQAVGLGKATVTVKTNNGGKTASCSYTVTLNGFYLATPTVIPKGSNSLQQFTKGTKLTLTDVVWSSVALKQVQVGFQYAHTGAWVSGSPQVAPIAVVGGGYKSLVAGKVDSSTLLEGDYVYVVGASTVSGAVRSWTQFFSVVKPIGGKLIADMSVSLSSGSRDQGVKNCAQKNGHCTPPPLPPSYAQARKANKTDVGGESGGDCGNFVATVVRATGVDKNFPAIGSQAQREYMIKSPKWVEVKNTGKLSDLKPGDIFNSDGGGHTFIYLGPNYQIAQASFQAQMPWHGDQKSFFTQFNSKGQFIWNGKVWRIFRPVG